MPIPDPTAQQIQRIGAYIQTRIPGADGTQLASDYEKYAADHPGTKPPQAFLAWMIIKLGPKVGKSFGLVFSSAGKAAQQIGAGTVKGLDKTGQNAIDRALGAIEQLLLNIGKAAGGAVGGLAGIGDFFGRLTEASTWVRFGEVALGIILIAIGVARLTNAVPMATKIARAIP